MHPIRITACAVAFLAATLGPGCGSGGPATPPSPPPSAPSAPEVTVSTGESAAIPEDFPKDIPLYEPMKVLSITQVSGEQTYVLQGSATDVFEKVEAAMKAKAEANGWQETTPETAIHDSTMSVRNYAKEKRTLNVTLFQQEAGTLINLSTGGA
ncbi:MAG: hypothetical protein WC655_16030 [Candidatus Hydrogenedentales bacterium]